MRELNTVHKNKTCISKSYFYGDGFSGFFVVPSGSIYHILLFFTILFIPCTVTSFNLIIIFLRLLRAFFLICLHTE